VDQVAQESRYFIQSVNVLEKGKMAYAQFLAGMAFNNASLGLVHGMAHQLGGFYDLPHGVCNAILLSHVTNFNKLAKPKKIAKIGKLLGANTEGMSIMEAADAGIKAIVDLSSDLGIPGSLEELEDVIGIFESAYKGF